MTAVGSARKEEREGGRVRRRKPRIVEIELTLKVAGLSLNQAQPFVSNVI